MPSLLFRRLGSLLIAVAVLATSAGQGLAMRHCAGMPTVDSGDMAGMPGMTDAAGAPQAEHGKAPTQAPPPSSHQCCDGMPGCCAAAPLAATSQIAFLSPSETVAIDVPSTGTIPRGPEPYQHSYPTGPPTTLTA